jgi:hypothetical protein
MLARQRALKLLSALVVALLSGGVAWAATDAVDGSPADAPPESTTTVSEAPTTESTSTTVESTTTTTVADEPETDAPETDAPETEEPAADECKPGWGHGDTNHCHSGPPGLSEEHRSKHGSGDDADDADEHEDEVEDDD